MTAWPSLDWSSPSSPCPFVLPDAVYGRPRTLSKLEVLELAARVSYQSWEQVAGSAFVPDYAHATTIADLFRQIGHDEGVHKEESLARTAEARFR